MTTDDQNELIGLGKKLNPDIKFFQAAMARREYRLEWTQLPT